MKLSEINLRDLIKTACEVVAALSAAIVAGIAIWGVFFTDLPETLFRQLRSDVAETNEALVDLRKQRRTLEGQLDQERTAVLAAEARREKIRGEVESLSREKANLERKMAVLTEERRSYFRNVKRIAIDRFFHAVSTSLKKLYLQTSMAQTYKDYLDRKYLMYKTKGKSRKSNSEAIHNFAESISDAWLIAELREFQSDRPKSMSDTIAEFKERVTRKPGKSFPTGRTLVVSHFDDDAFSLFLPRDRQAVRDQIEAFLNKHRDEFLKPLAVAMPPGWTPDTLRDAAIKTEANHRQVKTRLEELHKKLIPQN